MRIDSSKSGRSRDAAKLLIKSPYKAESKAGLRLVGSSPLGFDSLKSGRSLDAALSSQKLKSSQSHLSHCGFESLIAKSNGRTNPFLTARRHFFSFLDSGLKRRIGFLDLFRLRSKARRGSDF